MTNSNNTNSTDKNFYVASKYGCTWYGKVSDMDAEYAYPHDTEYFTTEQEAKNEAEKIQENANA